MKLAVTADLHFNVPRSTEPAAAVIAQIRRVRPDVVLLVGDTAADDLAVLSECLHLFDGCAAHKLFVAGNHELWTADEDTLRRYERDLPRAAAEAGFHYLDGGPTVIDGVGFVGSVGWYDYSFRTPGLDLPTRFYEAKVAPGAARVLPEHQHLIGSAEDIPEELMSLGTRWMDGVRVHLPYSDEEFTERLAQKLETHLCEIEGRAETIVAGIHHLPFRELVEYRNEPRWDFAAAFMGSERLGEVLRRHKKVHFLFCGHSHLAARTQVGHVRCVNIGSTYEVKRFEVVELPAPG